MRVTPPFWYAVFGGCLDGTQYAKGRVTFVVFLDENWTFLK